MVLVTTTVFSTRFWRSAQRNLALLLAGAWLCLLATSNAWADNAEITELKVERDDAALVLSATVKFEPTTLVEDALQKGIPMFFVAEVEILRNRWYWTDLKVAGEARHMRLAYQPLTRRWRLNVGSKPIGNSGLGVTLTQNFETMGDALAAVQRFSRWQVADSAAIDPDSTHTLRFRFALDVSQLPRPFQIGAVGQSDWNISATRTIRLSPEGTK
jgi:hypothetical protein